SDRRLGGSPGRRPSAGGWRGRPSVTSAGRLLGDGRVDLPDRGDRGFELAPGSADRGEHVVEVGEAGPLDHPLLVQGPGPPGGEAGGRAWPEGGGPARGG